MKRYRTFEKDRLTRSPNSLSGRKALLGLVAVTSTVVALLSGVAPATAVEPFSWSGTPMATAVAPAVQTAAAPKAQAAVGIRPMVAGQPGVPSAPEVLFEEDFENVPGTAPVILNNYVSPEGYRYTAAPTWLTNCNGMIVNFNIPYTSAGNCAVPASSAHLRQLVYALGVHAGAANPNANDAVSAYTEGDPGANLSEFETVNPIPLASASGRFLTFSVDAAAKNCPPVASAPLYNFSFLSPDGTATPVGGQINACTSPTTVPAPTVGPVGAANISVGTYTSNGSVLLDGASVGVRMINANGSGGGNDAAFDNIRILDVTPQLDKAFSPTTVFVDGVSTLTFTVTNTSELAAKAGWGFTDTLPEGLVVAPTPNVGGTCDVTTTATAGSDTIVAADGNLAAGEVSCTITVDVTSDTSGSYTNGPDNVTETGLNPPADTTVEVLALDFGDAPDSYGTTAASNGAHHGIVDFDADSGTSSIMLGATIDPEDDGQPTDDATGDDANDLADEDGVSFNPELGYTNPTLRTGLDPVSLQPIENTLEVEASADGFVSVWVDWNQDGTFTDDERVANAQAVTAGTNDVTFSQGTNPANISSFVRVRYSTDAASIATPTGAAPDGEVEDYRVLFERLVQPDTCTVDGASFYAFTFGDPVDQAGDGGVGSTARYENVTVIDGVAVDMVVEVTAGTLSATGFFQSAGDDAAWNVRSDGTIRYSFYEAGTTDPVDINAVFTVNDMDGSPDTIDEVSTWDAADLAGYGVTEGSRVEIAESAGSVAFTGHGLNNGDPLSRFQVVLEGVNTFEVNWRGSSNAGFTFDGDGDIGIDPPACSDFGDAPDSYGTTAAVNGAQHQIVPGLTIGSAIDFDPNGQPSDDATGDDANRLDDEDGVSAEIVATVGEETTVTVSATNSTGEAATLAGWIDLDGSGTFDAGELVTVAVPANSGTADYELTFPAGTTTDDTFARFRLFPASVTEFLPTGPAPAGEVEDYAVTVIERELSIEKTSDMTVDSRVGDEMTYTITATNTGTDAYTEEFPAVVLDDLTGVLDDASDPTDLAAEASDGSDVPEPAFVAPSFLSWAGPLAAGETVTITYTVTLEAGGDGTVRNVAWQPTTPPPPGVPPTEVPECDPPTGDGTDPVTGEVCASTTGELPKLTIAKTSDVTDLPADGGTVTYTVTVANIGPGDFTEDAPATMTDDLSDVLDDGEFGEILTPVDGADFDEQASELTWSGILEAGESIDISYTVVYDSTTGDNVLLNSACIPEGDAAEPDAACDFVSIPGAALRMDKSVDPADGTTVVAGQDVTYTLTFENVGQAPADVDALDTLTDVLDDAELTAGPTADPGLIATLTGDELAITGEVPVGETLTVTYTVTVEAYADQGDHVLGNVLSNADGTCPPGGCLETENPIRHLTVDKSADPAEGVQAGDVVTYTVTITNDGEGDYTVDSPAVVNDDMTDVLDDAAYNGDAVAEGPAWVQVPAPAFAAPVLTWSGALAAGDTVTITYTVTVTNLGDHDLVNSAGAVCESPEICDPPTDVTVLLPSIVPGKSSDPASGEAVNAGDVITYTLTFTNEGQAAGPVDATDDLSDILDDAEITSDPVADLAGIDAVLDLDAQTIRVTGDLAPGETVTVTYEVTVLPDGERGDNIAGNVLTPDVPPFVPDPECDPVDCPPFVPPTTEHRIGELDDWKTVDPASGATVRPGQQVTFTLHFENIGEAPVDVNRDDVLTQVLDDAAITAAPTASDAALTVTDVVDGRFSVTGTLEAGASVTVTYTVTVNADGERGDDRLANFLVDAGEVPSDTCDPADAARADCTINHISNVVATKSADPVSGSEVEQGERVTYTLTFRNVSTNPDAAAADIDYTDHMADVLDDATVTGGPDSSDPAVSAVLSGEHIRVVGEVASGSTVTVTYTVTVKAYNQQGDHALGNVLAVTGEAPICAPGSQLCTSHELTPPPPLAVTGGNSVLAGAIWALILMLIGGGVLLIARRRRSEEGASL